jgi:t-SNARE complex subunit (syntaxin)
MMNTSGRFGSYDASSYSSYHAAGATSSHGMTSDFLRLMQVVSTNIHKINQNVSQMQRMISQIGSQMDNPELRDKLHQIQHYTNQLAKETSQHTKDLAHLPQVALTPSEQRQRRVQKERLMNEFTAALSNFQSAQRLEKEREKECVDRSRHLSDPFADEPPSSDAQLLIPSDGPAELRQNQSVMMEDVDMELLQDQEQAIRKLEEDIVAVNQIFKDLGVLVHEQGDMIDSIEANIENASVSVTQGTEQLRQARNHQLKVRRRKFCIALVVIITVIIVSIIIGVSISH